MITGQCLCGAVRVEIAALPNDFGICHCKMCQRWTGLAFCGAEVPDGNVTVHGAENATVYRSSPTSTRSFCKACGSTLWFRDDDRPAYEIAMGLLDSEDGVRVTREIFVDRRSDAWRVAGDLPATTEAEHLARKEGR